MFDIEGLLGVREGEKPLDVLSPTCGYAGIFKKIGVIGDSKCSGEFESRDEEGKVSYNDMYEYSWPAILERITGTKYENYCRGGMTAKEYYDTWADRHGFWRWNQAYIIALGNNDTLVLHYPMGTVADVHPEAPEKNADTFFGNMGKIICKLRGIEPKCRIFLVTPQRRNSPDDVDLDAISEGLRAFPSMFPFTYVIDMAKYGPAYDEEMRRRMAMGWHPMPQGYYAYALMIGNYIDYIIREHMDDFAEIGFIGTNLHR